MKFKERLLQGILIKRYKRFFVDIKYKNKIITGHCPNSGSMMRLLNKGNKVWFSESDNPNRKLIVCIIALSLSGTILTSSTLTPSSLSHLDIFITFISCVLPDKISLPIIIIDALTFLLAFFIF